MKKQKKEISSFKMLNQLMDEGQIKNPYRFFRVYHPVYEVAVNVDIERTVDEYHIIEKYMDKLVCGYTGDKGTVTDKVYIKDRKQLYGLLGLEHQAYEVAERFFEDLLMEGHFVETKEGIRATQTAQNSIKLQKKCMASTEKQKKLFDAFTLELLPSDFYEMMHHAVGEDEINENDTNLIRAVWLNPRYISENIHVYVDREIKRHNYSNQEIIKKGLPQGYQRMRVDAEGEITLKFFPYYLVIQGGPEDYHRFYRAFRVDKPQRIDGVDYRGLEYSEVKEMLNGLSERMDEREIAHPLCDGITICKGGIACHNEGVYFDYECKGIVRNGNYYWKVQDKQIKKLLCLDGNSRFQRTVCKKIAEGNVAALTGGNAGRLLYIEKTEKQKQLLLEAVRSPECDRKQLFEKYLGGESFEMSKKGNEKKTNAKKGHDRVEDEIERGKELLRSHKYDEAMEVFLQYTDKSVEAVFRIGVMYYLGQGVRRDYDKAIQWFLLAMEKGHVQAQLNLASIYLSKQDAPDYRSKGLKIYEKLSEEGIVEASMRLVAIYSRGLWGIEKNLFEREKWLRKAAEQGNKVAKNLCEKEGIKL